VVVVARLGESDPGKEYLEDLERAEDSDPFAREDRSTGLWNEGPGGQPGSS